MSEITIEQKLTASAEAHREWAKRVPGTGQLTMTAALMESAASEIETLRQRVRELESEIDNLKRSERGRIKADSDLNEALNIAAGKYIP